MMEWICLNILGILRIWPQQFSQENDRYKQIAEGGVYVEYKSYYSKKVR